MTLLADYAPFALLGVAVIIFLLMRQKPWGDRIEDNYTIPHKAALEIAVAQLEGRPALFHARCNDCIWRQQNTTHAGVLFCRGCSYFAWNRSLPDKAISEYDLEKIG